MSHCAAAGDKLKDTHKGQGFTGIRIQVQDDEEGTPVTLLIGLKWWVVSMRKINKTRAYLVRCPLVHPLSHCTPVVGVIDVVSVLRFEVVGVLPPYRIPSECRGVVVSIASGASGPPSCVSSEQGVVEAKKTLRLAFEQRRGGGGQTPPPV